MASLTFLELAIAEFLCQLLVCVWNLVLSLVAEDLSEISRVKVVQLSYKTSVHCTLSRYQHLLGADSETEVCAGIGELVSTTLHIRFCVSVEGK